ncbi:MAG TPA: PAS domain S-box protein [Terriglobales bacterium]|nr:PAS domain S-box protein [Terriglobales bacterium]
MLRTVGLFLLLVVALLVGATLTYRATTRIEASEARVTHTYAVIGALDSLMLTVQNAQTHASDFVATGKDEYLAAYRKSTSHISEKVAAIRTLTSDNPDQQTAIRDVEGKAQHLKEFLDNAVDYRIHGSFSQPTGEQLDEVVGNLRAMKLREQDLLRQRSKEAAVSLRTTMIGVLVGAAFNCLLLLIGGFMVLRDQEQRLQIRQSRLRLAAIVDSSDDAILSKKLDGTITSWNYGAERLYGYMAEEMIGHSIYDIVPPERQEELRSILDRLGHGQGTEHLETLRKRRDGSLIEVELLVSPLKDENGRVVEASAIARDITHRKQLERSLHQLSVGILKTQDEERRRIAREIHDTTVQKLALLSMNLAQLKAPANPAKTTTMLENSQELAKQCVQELRTLSYVLHPPMLDELGLASALKIYVEGIAQRSGVTIETEFDSQMPRLPHDVEMALFRVAQEGLSNVLRHSGSKTARIELLNGAGVTLKISDRGSGMAKVWDSETPVAVGVGIAGMNERMRQLGGRLTIDSGPRGTTVTAYVPGSAAHA